MGSLIFNTFVWCQIYNEFNARNLGDDWNVFIGLDKNPVFIGVIIITITLQILLVEFGGEFVETSELSATQWVGTVFLAMLTWPVGVFMRFIPVDEDPASFSSHDTSNWNNSEDINDDKKSRYKDSGKVTLLNNTENVLLEKLV
jgi:magnesium-transporting ATPase (P-type)